MTTAEFLIHNVTVLDGDPATFSADVADHWIAASAGTIIARGRGTHYDHLVDPAITEVVDGGGGYLGPGYVDIHCHGGGGFTFEDGPQGLPEILAVHRKHGTRALLLSSVSDTIDGLCVSLAMGAELTRTNAAVLGLHAEGPFLSPNFKGAHAPEVLTPPTAEAVDRVLESADGALRQVTLAPELPGAVDAISRFTSAGVKVAVGHTASDYEGAALAFDAGASILTHTFNGLPGIHHRNPGPILAAVDAGHVTLELINDGVHVAAPAARMIANLAPDRVALITDSMSATGMSDGEYQLGSLSVRVEDSVARLVDADGSLGSIAGSTLTMDRAVELAVSSVGLSPLEAVRAASSTPLRALGLLGDADAGGGDAGLLSVGKPADLLLLDEQMTILRSWMKD